MLYTYAGKFFGGSAQYIVGAANYSKAMTSPSKRPATRAGGPKKERLSRAEASRRLLEHTSQLLLEFHPADVTVARICERAGVHIDYVARYFGSRDELLCQAIEYPFDDAFLSTESKDTSRLQFLLQGDEYIKHFARARVQTIAYLLGCGVGPERFQPHQKQLIDSVLLQSINPNTSDRAKKTLVLVGMLLVQGMNTFAEVNEMTDQEKLDVMNVLSYLSQSGDVIEAALASNVQNKTKSKKLK
jgi:AcrR family transcriptional regulator